MNLPRVRVGLTPRGAWEIVMPERADKLRCRTLEEASHIARRLAATIGPCELIVQDAYHRVVEHELIQLGGETLSSVRAAIAPREPGPAEKPGSEAGGGEAGRTEAGSSEAGASEEARLATGARA